MTERLGAFMQSEVLIMQATFLMEMCLYQYAGEIMCQVTLSHTAQLLPRISDVNWRRLHVNQPPPEM